MKFNAKGNYVILSLLASVIHARPFFGVIGDAAKGANLGKTGKAGGQAVQTGGDLTKVAKGAPSTKPGGFLSKPTPSRTEPIKTNKPVEPTKPVEPSHKSPLFPVPKARESHNGEPLIKVPKKETPKVIAPQGVQPKDGYEFAFWYKRTPLAPKWSDELKANYFKLEGLAEGEAVVTFVNKAQQSRAAARIKAMEALGITLSEDGDELVEIADGALDARALETGEGVELANGGKSGTSSSQKPAESAKRITFQPSEVLDLANGAEPRTPEAARLAEVVRPKADAFDIMQPRRLQHSTKGAARIMNEAARNLNHQIRTLYLELLNSKLAALAQADFERFQALYTFVSHLVDDKTKQLIAQIARIRSQLPGANAIVRGEQASKDEVTIRRLSSFFAMSPP